jgi:hypothetical protein
LKIVFRSNDDKKQPLNIVIPLAADDLDIAHTQLSAGLHLTVFKR